MTPERLSLDDLACLSHIEELDYSQISYCTKISMFRLVYPVLLLDLQYLAKPCVSGNFGNCGLLN